MSAGWRGVVLGLALAATVVRSASAQADSTKSFGPLFTRADALLAGSVIIGTLFAQRLDDHYAARLQDSSTQANKKLQRLATFVRTTAAPGALLIGTTMYAVGRITKEERLAELGLHGTEALLIGELTGGIIKGFVGRQRPYVRPRNPHSYGFLRGFGGGDQYRSFPSGHTVAAFAAASAVTSQTSNWWPNSRILIGTAMYGGAALTGISRMYDNRHWASDVIVGAGIGTFAGLKVVRFNNSHSGNKLDTWLLSASITPNGDGGHALRWSLMPGVAIGKKPPGR
ncbi:MAG: phosphatase PAP2 family protein [bacterium]